MTAQLWHKAPFLRLLIALATGALVQWYGQLPLTALLVCFVTALLLTVAYSFIAVKHRYQLRVLAGSTFFLLVAVVGSLSIWLNDVRHKDRWFGKYSVPGSSIVVTLNEPLVEKPNSYKALAAVDYVITKDKQVATDGTLLLYFKKDSLAPPVQYGSRLVISHALQPIKNAGNPGSFDYQTYSLFHGITHQVNLSANDYVVLSSGHTDWFYTFIYNTRFWVLATLKQFIPGTKEQGLAEALLIGYKDDLDKNLVQAYSNTGVVHIIAISGLHLGLIYALLVLLTRRMKNGKQLRWARFFLIVSCLWLFSILAGGGPSVLRSALMFTVMAVGEVALRRTNIFNTLAFSAFVLLCINPFWLWDVGFQLSYAAVLSIILFFQPVYNWYRSANKIIDFFWKLTAVTIAAQILTLPISIYHFHQMPLLFLVTNFVAVPLSSGILLGEIALCFLSFLPAVANVIGAILKYLILAMNSYIERLDTLPFSTLNFLSISIFQTVVLLLFAIAFCYWAMDGRRWQAQVAAACFSLFMVARGVSFYHAYNQRQLIVYNVPKHPAIDIIDGTNYLFLGDSSLLLDGFERNFHLQPSRILHRTSMQKAVSHLTDFTITGKHILVLDETVRLLPLEQKQTIDLLVLSRNPKLYISRLAARFSLQQVVIDGSVPPWKAALWKKDCDSLKIPCYNVSERGAFVMNR